MPHPTNWLAAKVIIHSCIWYKPVVIDIRMHHHQDYLLFIYIYVHIIHLKSSYNPFIYNPFIYIYILDMESRSEDGPQEEMEKWGPQEFRRTCDSGSAPRENGEVPFLMGKLLGSPWFITASNCWTLTVNLELKSDERGLQANFFYWDVPLCTCC